MDFWAFGRLLGIFYPNSEDFDPQTSVSARCCELKWGAYRKTPPLSSQRGRKINPSLPHRDQARIAACGRRVDRHRLLEREAAEIVRPAGFRASSREA